MEQNTKHTGVLRFFTYYDEKDKEFVGVCVDLGIVKCGDNPYYVEKDLIDASVGYVEAVQKEHLPDYLLNQKSARAYLKIYDSIRAMAGGAASAGRQISKDDARIFFKSVPELCPAAS